MQVLAVGAHPDDIECYCAGLLAKYAARGDRVCAVVCTNGELGSVTLPPAELSALREQESRAAAELYGAELRWLGEPDGQLWVTAATRATLAGVFAEWEPDVVLTHHLEDYHPDHRACSELVTGACGARRTPSGAGPLLLYMDTSAAVGFLPDAYVDITDTMETKVAALACHRSQVEWLAAHDEVDLLAWLRATNRARGHECGVEYAEGYRFVGGAGPGLRELLP
jgi:LmbE family N-acetylglucosaminyl deacetylase